MEASLVITIFIFAMLAFLQMGYVLVVNKYIYSAFANAVEKTASDAYGWKTALDGQMDVVVYGRIYSGLRKELKDNSLVAQYVNGGINGVLLTSAAVTQDGYVDAKLCYTVHLNIPLMQKLKAVFYEYQRQKAYIGFVETASIDTYVYVTDYQSVYHSSRSCSHLSLQISEVTEATAKGKGAGLSACSFCKQLGDRYYITKQGDCYHTSLACPGLSRTIYRVRLSSLRGIGLCSRCNQGR